MKIILTSKISLYTGRGEGSTESGHARRKGKRYFVRTPVFSTECDALLDGVSAMRCTSALKREREREKEREIKKERERAQGRAGQSSTHTHTQHTQNTQTGWALGHEHFQP